jgi:hypothetical protein
MLVSVLGFDALWVVGLVGLWVLLLFFGFWACERP